MSAISQTERVVLQLREIILSGEVEPGERLTEIQYAKRLGVSRTPLRLAFSELEKEGLLEHKPSRGFRVRSFSISHIGDAVEVRGVLEGMAARILSEKGMSAETKKILEDAVKAGQDIINQALKEGCMIDSQTWRKINHDFHEGLVKGTNNLALINTIEFNNKVPFSGPASMTLNTAPTLLETGFVQQAQKDHENVLNALLQRQGSRAESLMREHAYMSRLNKNQLIQEMRARKSNNSASPSLSEAALVLEQNQA